MAGPPTVNKAGKKPNTIPKKPVRKPGKTQKPTVHGKPALTATPRAIKEFTTVAWTGAGQGQKIMVYGRNGMGKTSLAALLSDPVFIGIDDGGRLIKDLDGNDLRHIPNVEDFQDIRDLFQSDYVDRESFDQCVLDTVTDAHRWAVPYVLQTVPKDKDSFADNLEDYGWRKGYRYWFEAMQKLLSDMDLWVHKGKDIILIAQETGIKITNEGGEDYRIAGPDLHHDAQVSILNLVKGWCDHVFRIAYANVFVKEKKARSDESRAIFIHPKATHIAKSRTIPAQWSSVTFDSKADDSIWRLLEDPNQ